MAVFHNTSHLAPGDRSIVPHFSHFELESLPTGGWGYDHFPISAAFARTLGKPYVGMTGKFHTFWGEYGGYKHPNALRYECALMLAFGGGCSVGDQLDPTGAVDPSTYSIIGQAYREVARKEAWCVGVQAVADIALLSPSGHARPGETDWISRQHPVDAGCARLLLESHYLFDVVDRFSDFSPYRLLILPDIIRIDAELARRLEDYRAAGGKLLLSGQSGLNPEGSAFALDVGASYQGLSTFNPDYILPCRSFGPISSTGRWSCMRPPTASVRRPGGHSGRCSIRISIAVPHISATICIHQPSRSPQGLTVVSPWTTWCTWRTRFSRSIATREPWR